MHGHSGCLRTSVLFFRLQEKRTAFANIQHKPVAFTTLPQVNRPVLDVFYPTCSREAEGLPEFSKKTLVQLVDSVYLNEVTGSMCAQTFHNGSCLWISTLRGTR
jgi:hypothetical protein